MATPPVFSTGAVLTAAQMNSVSSWKLVDTNFTTSTLVQIENVFTEDFDHYEIIITLFGSAASAVSLKFHTATATPTTTNDFFRYGFYLTPAGAFTNFYQANVADSFVTNFGTTAGVISSSTMTIIAPYSNSQRTHIYNRAYDAQGGLFIDTITQWILNTRFTGFRLTPAGGNITGNIQVRGWRT